MRRFGWRSFGWGESGPPPAPAAPEMTQAPAVIASTITVGETLSADPGRWSGWPRPALEIRWQYRPPAGSWTLDGAGSTYTVPEAAEGGDIRVQVRATNSEGQTAYQSSAAVGPVLAQESGDAGPIRTATPTSAVVNYNGHSLIDTATWNQNEDGYTWMHAVYEDLIGDLLSPAAPPAINRTSIAGSSTQWRWDHPEGGGYNARGNMGENDLLVLAEGGPHFITRISDGEEDPLREGFVELINGQLNWVDLAADEGAGGDGAEVIYYQIWPALDGWEGESYVDRTWTFEQWVDEYDRTAKFFAEYWSHHLGRQVYVCPGHRLYARLKQDCAADLVPGYEAIEDLYPEGDTIHPYKPGAWPMRLMLAAMIYKVDPGSVTISRPPYITEAYHDYCCGLAWDVLQEYALAGFGGTDWGAGDGYAHGVTPDPLNPPDPEEPEEPGPEDLPAFAMAATPDGYTGPTLSGSPTSAGAPVWDGGEWLIDGAVTAALSRSGPVYCCAVIRVTDIPSPAVRGPQLVVHANATWWMGDQYGLIYNGHISGGVFQTDQSGDVGGVENLGPATTGYALVWWYNDGTESGGGSAASPATPIAAPAVPTTAFLTIGGNIDGAPDIELRGLWVWTPDGDPADQLAAVRALAATYIPG